MRIFCLVTVLSLACAASAYAQAPAGRGTPVNRPPSLVLSSASYADGAVIPDKYTS